jgi:hypothetical protein
MLKRLVLGSVLGTAIVVFSSVGSFADKITHFENQLNFNLHLLSSLETRLKLVEENGGPLFLERFLQRAITIEEKRIAKLECRLGHCGVSAF